MTAVKLPKTHDIPWLIELNKVFGLHETRDKVKLSTWLKSDGATLGDPTKLPWCGDGVDTALELALPNEPRPGDLGKNPYWALNWLYLGKECLSCYGAIVVFKRPSGGHVGFVIGTSADAYLVYGCNQSDSVGLTWISKGRCKGIRWPSTYKNPNIPLPVLSRQQTLSQNES